NDVAFERVEVGTEIAVVTEINGVTLQAFEGGGERHAAERHGQHVLHVADGQAVAGDGVAVDFKFNVASAHDTFSVGAGRTRHGADNGFNFRADAFQFFQVRSGNLYADGGFDAGGEHADAGGNGHGPKIIQPGNLHGGIHGIFQFIRRAAAMRDDAAVVVLDVHRRPLFFRL